VEVAVVGRPDDPRTPALHREALLADVPGLVVALGDGEADDRGTGDPLVPRETFPALLEGRGPVGDAPAAYVCRGFTCRMPVTTVEELRAELARA
ncbi:MAG: N-acylglucosamine 2-epimerase, partial [Nonomuraea sp.]|nr:N-acylglucosamine 2-epimerase [Nonomuraea sp.]